ncbi:hypothetical protein B1R27_10770 [Streptomyces sp. GKU 895]|nr:hypothetical protein B1R27_10770 [Streptomyces sp. GKU 895]
MSTPPATSAGTESVKVPPVPACTPRWTGALVLAHGSARGSVHPCPVPPPSVTSNVALHGLPCAPAAAGHVPSTVHAESSP